MGYLPMPFVQPLYCSAQPGHILLEWYDGSVIDCESTIKVSIPRQLNPFKSNYAKWVLRHDDTVFVGNSIGTYLQIREYDGTLLTCGTWDATKCPKFIPAGEDSHYTCWLCENDRKTIISSQRLEAFVANEPIKEVYPDESQMIAGFTAQGSPIVLTERGFLNFATDGTWVSPPKCRWAIDFVKLGFL